MTARLLLVLLATLAGGLRSQEAASQPAPRLQWESEVEAAYKKAKELGRPVLYVIMKDKEIGCRRMLEKVWTDAGVIAKSQEFVLLPCSMYHHQPVTLRIDGKEVESCPQFAGVSCAQHQTIEKWMRENYQPKGEVVAPQHLFTDPEGRLLTRREYEVGAADMIKLMDRALRMHQGKPAEPPVSKDPAGEMGDPEPGEPGEGESAAAELSPDAERLLEMIATGDAETRRDAVQSLVSEENPLNVEALVDLLLSKRMKSTEDRGEVIRALGYPRFSHAALGLIPLLATKTKFLRNCTVVTMEEMANAAVAPALTELWKKEKDPEVKKDILRALGPAGGGHEPALELLRKNLKSPNEKLRMASAMGLGYWLASQEDVRDDLKKRYRREGRSAKVKTAILYAYRTSGDAKFADDIRAMQKEERNADMKTLGELVMAHLEGREPELDSNRGGGGRGGRGGGRGGWRNNPTFRYYTLIRPLVADDKIVRNAVREILERWGNRGR